MAKKAVGFSFMYPWYTIWCFLACIGLLLAVPAHIRARNSSTLLFFAWAIIANVIMVADTIIWRDSLRNPSVAYCDISTKILAMYPHAMACCGLCINVRLWKISRVSAVLFTKKDKRNMVYFDLGIGLVVPLVFGALHYVVQGHRYDIYEDVGCLATNYNVTLAYPIYLIWPAIISFIAGCIGAMALRQFIIRRDAFANHLMSNNSGETKSRYLRLMALSSTELLLTFPLSIYKLVIDLTDFTVYPWKSWADTKWGFNRVNYYPRIVLDRFPKTLMVVIYCGVPLSATFFFIWFGLCNEAIETYTTAFFWCLKPFGVRRPPPGSPSLLDKLFGRKPTAQLTDTTASLPTFEHRTTGPHPSEGLHLDIDKLDFLSTVPLPTGQTSTTKANASERRSSYSASISFDEKDSVKGVESTPPSPGEQSRSVPPMTEKDEKGISRIV